MNLMTDLMGKGNQSTQNPLAIRSDLDLVWDNCQKMKTQMNELLAALLSRTVLICCYLLGVSHVHGCC